MSDTIFTVAGDDIKITEPLTNTHRRGRGGVHDAWCHGGCGDPHGDVGFLLQYKKQRYRGFIRGGAVWCLATKKMPVLQFHMMERRGHGRGEVAGPASGREGRDRARARRRTDGGAERGSPCAEAKGESVSLRLSIGDTDNVTSIKLQHATCRFLHAHDMKKECTKVRKVTTHFTARVDGDCQGAAHFGRPRRTSG